MTVVGWAQLAVFVVALTAVTPLLGGYMSKVYQGERVALSALLGPVQRVVYRVLRIAPGDEQDWRAYARAVLIFSLASWLVLYAVLRAQGAEPLNPQGFAAGPWTLSFNTASSFVSNTSWQFYAGETTLSYFAQMAGITVASFTSGAVGMAVAVAFIRGLARRETQAHSATPRRCTHTCPKPTTTGPHSRDTPASSSRRRGTSARTASRSQTSPADWR